MTNYDIYTVMRQIVMKVTGLKQVYLADQAVQAPSGTYATIRVAQGVQPMALGTVRRTYDKEKQTVTETVSCPVRYDIPVNFYRAGAMDYAPMLINCSRLSGVHALLLSKRLGWAGSDPVQNLTALQSSEQEERAVIVVHLVGEKKVSEIVNTIEAARIIVEDEKTNVLQDSDVDSH